MIEDINTLTYDSFIQNIKTIKTYRSNDNKEYKVVKANKTRWYLEISAPRLILKCRLYKFSMPCKSLALKTVRFLKCGSM